MIDYFQKSTDIFPSVEIKGGVAVTLRDANQDFGAIGFFSQYAELRSILRKVMEDKGFIKGQFAELISARGMFRFSPTFFKEHPEASWALEKGTGNMITSNSAYSGGYPFSISGDIRSLPS